MKKAEALTSRRHAGKAGRAPVAGEVQHRGITVFKNLEYPFYRTSQTSSLVRHIFAMTEVKRYKIKEPWLDIHCGLGEGPHWDVSRNTLRFVDIVNKKVHQVDLAKGPSSLKTFDVKECVTVSADIEGNDKQFVYGGKFGYGVMHKDTGEVRNLQFFWTDAEREDDGGGKPGKGRNLEERMRSNDGAVDRNGRFWVGTMNDDAVVGSNFTDEGVLFRLDSDLSLHRVRENVTIPNGTTWSNDDKTIYFTDSPTSKINAYPYNSETGEVSWAEGKTHFQVEGGVPDGHCQDEEGHLWVAGHGTGKVFRVDPQGQVVAEVELPTRCVTCPTLCGTELFITTMGETEPEKHPESLKYQGAVFKVEVGVRGQPLNKFKMPESV